MSELPQKAKDLLDAPSFVVLTTINEDGSPQSTILWAKHDDDQVVLSTVRGRRKERNLVRDPRASVVILDQTDPYSYVEVRGTTTLTEEGGRELINELSHVYAGADYTADGPDDVRVIVRLAPEHVVANG